MANLVLRRSAELSPTQRLDVISHIHPAATPNGMHSVENDILSFIFDDNDTINLSQMSIFRLHRRRTPKSEIKLKVGHIIPENVKNIPI